MQVFLNGQFVNESEARISPFDRGFLFGDGVYEALRYFDRQPVLMDKHIRRLARSMAEIGIQGADPALFADVGDELLKRNELHNAGVYWQVTRGRDELRTHLPTEDAEPTVFAYAWALPDLEHASQHLQTTSLTTFPDWRWARCDIKATSLLPNILARLHAADHDAEEAVLYRGDWISECASSNIWLVQADGSLVTPPIDDSAGSGKILEGTSRSLLLGLDDLPTVARRMRLDELTAASEVFITSAIRILHAVTHIDGQPVGTGTVGPTTQRVYDHMMQQIRHQCTADQLA